MIAIYARVSSKSQDSASQEPDLKRWADTQGGPARWYRDTFTGRTMNRPGWNELWKGIESGEVRTVVAWRLDRLGRTALELLQLAKELRARKVKLVLLREGLTLGDESAAGKMFLTMLAAFAEYELEVRSERQLAGIAAAKERGVTFGRPKGTGRAISVGEETRELVRKLKAEGARPAAIARMTKLSRTTVYQILKAG